MEVAEALRRRRMVRAYDPGRPVPSELVDAVCAAALRTPSAGFTQGVSLLVASTDQSRSAFWAATADGDSAWLRGMRSAPVLIMLWTSRQAYLDRYAESDKGWVDRDPDRWSAPYWYVDGGMAALAALVTAVDQGLGACFFGIPVERVPRVRTSFAVPADQLSVGVISLGYSVPAPASGSPTRRARKPTEALLHRETWSSLR
ncbi:MAG TPA: nitroreductase family protein [Propionibacteriaceae bacterium]|nr:nitroreductase family protein [Propionibacteriaceae bacterium]